MSRQTRFAATRLVRLLSLLLLIGADGAATEVAYTRSSPAEPERIDGRLAPYLAEYELPSLAAAVYRGDAVVAAGVAGVRRAGSDIQVTIDDLYHVGSVTKSMTATMIAVLVERGDLRWDAGVLEVFPEFAPVGRPEYRSATLRHLLSHTAGLHDPFTAEQWASIPLDEIRPPVAQRLEAVERALESPPLWAPGQGWEYANIGYTVAASMAERVTGTDWQQLMRTLLFAPLGLESAGFGWPATEDRPDQPWGHVVDAEPTATSIGRLTIWPPGHPHRIPLVIAPAGDVHMSIEDLARWGGVHLRGLRGDDTLVSHRTMGQLHTIVAEGYAFGWNVVPDGTRSLPGAEQHQHLGSGGTFTAIIAVFPTLDIAVVAVHNGGSNQPAVAAVMYALARQYSQSSR